MLSNQSNGHTLQMLNITVFRPVFAFFFKVKVDFWQKRFGQRSVARSHILIGFFVATFLVTTKPLRKIRCCGNGIH